MMLSKLALKQKLIGGFGVVLLSASIGAVFSIVETRSLASYVAKAAAIHELTEVGTVAADMIGIERGIVLYSIFDSKADVQQNKTRFEEAAKNFSASLEKMKGTFTSTDARQSIDTLRQKYDRWMSMHDEIVGLLDKQQVDVAEKKVGDASFTAAVDEMRKVANDMSAHEAELLKKQTSNAEFTALIGFVVLGVISMGIGALVLVHVQHVSNRLSSLTDSLAGNSEEVATLSAGVHDASESVASESSSQAASLQQTAASSEEITAMTRQNVEHSQSAAAVMAEVDDNIKAGNRTLELMLVSMNEINSSSDNISKIIRVIDEIAFQTNILALNAAVEAARAGEAGMGFAVVADEVRTLAQRSAQAARDTTVMIEESIAKSNDGSAKLHQLTEVVRNITESAAKVKTLVDSVNSGSLEQARGIEQISKAVTQMEHLTQGTARSAEQSASASDKLSAQARALNQVVVELRELVDGQRV